MNFDTSNRRYIDTITWICLKSLGKPAAIVGGRIAHKWYSRLDLAKRKKINESFHQNQVLIYGLCSAFVFGGFAYYINHLESAPITGRKRFLTYTHEQILQIAQLQTDILMQLYSNKMYSKEEPKVKRLHKVIQKLIDTNSEIKEVAISNWQIHLINDPMVNAFLLPSGHIFVFEGLLTLANTDDQLAVILGHEMAHAVLNHDIESLSLSGFIDVGIIICFAYIWFLLPSIPRAIVATWLLYTAVNLAMYMPHSRRLEWEADFVGLVFAANACYDVREAGVLWRKIADHQKQTFTFLPAWMLTHPDSRKRAEFLDMLKADAELWRQNKGCAPLAPSKID